MSFTLASIKAAGCAAIVVAALGASAPAAVAGEPSLNLHFGIGGNGQPQFGFDVNSGDQADWGRPGRPGSNGGYGGHGGYGQYPAGGGINACASDRDVSRGLRNAGYRNIEIAGSDRRSADVEADYGRYHYVLDVNKCTGMIDVVDRYRAGRGGYSYRDANY